MDVQVDVEASMEFTFQMKCQIKMYWWLKFMNNVPLMRKHDADMPHHFATFNMDHSPLHEPAKLWEPKCSPSCDEWGSLHTVLYLLEYHNIFLTALLEYLAQLCKVFLLLQLYSCFRCLRDLLCSKLCLYSWIFYQWSCHSYISNDHVVQMLL